MRPNKVDCRRRQLQRALALRGRRAKKKRALARERDREFVVGRRRNMPNGRRPQELQVFECPEDLNLTGSFDQTARFLQTFRSFSSRSNQSKVYVDMRPIERVTPAAALLLVAELDRWRRKRRVPLRPRDAEEWNQQVRSRLDQMGFFDLLGGSNESFRLTEPSAIRYLRFQTGTNADGRPFLMLYSRLEALLGKLPGRPRLFQAVSEALVNVGQHAYLRKKKARERPTRQAGAKRWWISASVDTAHREVTVMVVDHGHGIPSTIRRKTTFEKVRKYIKNDDAEMIDAAIKLGRSGTDEPYRGHGFTRDILKFVDTHKKYARVRICSNRGVLTYEKQAGEPPKTSLANHKVGIGGTFIEWKYAI